MRAWLVFVSIALLLSACGQPDVTGQLASTQQAASPPYPVSTPLPYPLAGLAPYPMTTALMATVRSQAVSLLPCPEPTATPVATDTPLPTWTPAPPDFPTLTPVPMPSPAPFPGDFQLALSACAVQGAAPQTVRFNAVLTGGPDNSYELYCVGPDWQFGDGSGMMTFVDCIAWSPDVRVQRTFMTDYTYKQIGVYQARLKIESCGGTLESNVVTIEVR